MADFVLGRLKFKWRGDWSTSTAYLIDDIVKYGGNTYVCVTNHTSQSTEANFYTDLNSNSYWQLHTEGLFFKSDWAGSTFYKLNDLVKYGAYQYRCILQHTSASDFAIGSNWQTYTEGLQWEDTYNAGTTYQDGDVVSYGGYTYVYVNSTPSAGNTPTDNSYWDVITTGYNNTGEYNFSTSYKTGDVVRYGGYSYVSVTNHSGQYPANTDGTTNSSYWELIIKGFDYQQDAYSAATTYNIGDVVRYISSSYVMLKDRQQNVTPGSDGTVWQLIAQGDTGAVTNTRGDLIYNDGAATDRLPIGVVGSVLTTDGLDPIWSNPEGSNVIYVANSGDDTNPGTQFLPYKTVAKALSVSTSGDIVDFTFFGGGTGGTPGTYLATSSATSGSGTGARIRAITDGSSTPTVSLVNGGSGYVAGDTVTFPGASLGGSLDIVLTVTSASIGDVIYVKNGVYKETLPLRVPAGVTVRGESLRGTEIQPATGTGTQVATINTITGGTGGTPGTYNYLHQNSTSGSGNGIVVNVITDGSSTPTVTVYHGGYGYEVGDTVTLTDTAPDSSSQLGGATNITFTIATLENNNASNMFLVNNQTNITLMTMKNLSGTPVAGGTSKAAVVSLDPEGGITTASPYIQDCTSVNANSTGIQIDGNLHKNIAFTSNKSILANDFTQINSDGRGVHALGDGRGEMVSVFTYYCDKSFFAESGGFIRGLNCSSAYGEQGAVADGTNIDETPVTIQTRGEQLIYQPATLSTGTTSSIANAIAAQGRGQATVTGNTSGATARFFRYQISKDTLYIENRVGNFQQSETVTIQAEDSSTFTVNLSDNVGDSSAAQIGQINALIAVKSTDGTLSSTGVLKVGSNIIFSGDSTYYRIGAVTEEDTSGQTATIRTTIAIGTSDAKADGTSANVTSLFSNVRLTGHDFLDIGTGSFADTNYPNSVGVTQPSDQDDEVTETNGGRVYFSSTDQKGDFRVGDLFRIEQATGTATLNADAFDLSGLSELQLGSIGAEIGATINEFSTDQSLGGNSTTSVPTEYAIVGYLTRDFAGTGAWVPPTGTTAQRPTGDALYTGAIRYNSTLVTWEGYNGTQWTGLGGGNPWGSIDNTDSPYAIAANDRVFVDTSGGAVTITLPGSPLVGDQIRVLDLASTFDTNNLTIARNGNNINGAAADLVVSTEDSALGLVYTGATYGWKLIEVL